MTKRDDDGPAMRILRMMEWRGYSTDDGERACPCCEAWAYQPTRTPVHAYACGLATIIGAPMEDDITDTECDELG